mgnify:FL=1
MKSIIEIRNEFNSQIIKIEKEKEKVLRPMYIEYMRENKDNLVGQVFSTGNLDDEYKITDVNGDTFLVFQTWDEEMTDEIENCDMEFSQLEELYTYMINFKK